MSKDEYCTYTVLKKLGKIKETKQKLENDMKKYSSNEWNGMNQ